ncbi:trypsin-like peptidase domain-containing protein, partial [Candidatus Peregrinibacteria bacterium]|nr:trypsin-like peptidase domain-containing protein [Candidatus Peregrinibacteria bacterium]
MKEQNPIMIGAVSGGVTALIVAIVFSNFAPQVAKNPAGAGPVNATVDAGSGLAAKGVSQEAQVVSAVKKTAPAVVSVIITKDVPVLEKYYQQQPNPFGDNSPFGNDPFFNFQFPQYRQNGTEKKEVGGGSGFIVSADGYIVTNKHVVADPKAEYTVFIGNDKKKYPAKVISTDPVNDIAVIKIEANDLPYLEFADSDKLDVG